VPAGVPASGARLDELVDEPHAGSVGSVVWLHGMGQDARTMQGVAAAAGLHRTALRHVYLQAPIRAVGLLSATPVRAWLTQRVTQMRTADPVDLRETAWSVRRVLDRELDLGATRPVLLAGFSQGAALALMVATTHHRRLAGVAAYAPYLLKERHAPAGAFGPNGGLPIWLGHGSDDWTVPVAMGRAVRDGLADRYDVHWHEYPTGHVPFAGAEHDMADFVTEVVCSAAAP
jgi:phospholipase/carboxylesterase